MNKNVIRLIADTFLLFAVFILPWWAVLPLALLFVFYFDFYIESIIFSLFIDILYAPNSLFIGGYLVTFFSAALFLSLTLFKQRIILP